MKPLRARLEDTRKRTGMGWEVLERDYLLSWLLAGLYSVKSLRESLIFKGGTALKKCYFGDYRFSEDLDFSAKAGGPRGATLERAVSQACREVEQLLDEYAAVELTHERYTERDPHPGGQEAFVIRAKFPWHRQPQTSVQIEITVDEPVLTPPALRPIIHAYGEPIEVQVSTYSIDEIVAEKLRGVLQYAKKIEERGWARSRARDYYDLWRILTTYRAEIDTASFPSLLERKCAHRGVAFTRVEDFFQDLVTNEVMRTWKQWLEPLVPGLPSADQVLAYAKTLIEALLAKDRKK